jgi:hypothetical protein
MIKENKNFQKNIFLILKKLISKKAANSKAVSHLIALRVLDYCTPDLSCAQ